MYTIGGELVYVWGRTCIRLGANLYTIGGELVMGRNRPLPYCILWWPTVNTENVYFNGMNIYIDLNYILSAEMQFHFDTNAKLLLSLYECDFFLFQHNCKCKSLYFNTNANCFILSTDANFFILKTNAKFNFNTIGNFFISYKCNFFCNGSWY